MEDLPEVANHRMIGVELALVLGVLLHLGEVVVLIADDHGHELGRVEQLLCILFAYTLFIGTCK